LPEQYNQLYAELLFGAVSAGRENIVKLLLKKYRVEVNVFNKEGYTPLFIAVNAKNLGMTKCLLKGSANINASTKGGAPLFRAAHEGHFEIVKFLCNNGAAIDPPPTVRANSPLSVATYRGYYQIVKFLLESGANINNIAEDGSSPLILAAASGRIEILRLLLEKKADLTIRLKIVKDKAGNGFKKGDTALHVAARKNNIDAIKILLKHGATVDNQHKQEKIGVLLQHLDKLEKKAPDCWFESTHKLNVEKQNAVKKELINIILNDSAFIDKYSISHQDTDLLNEKWKQLKQCFNQLLNKYQLTTHPMFVKLFKDIISLISSIEGNGLSADNNLKILLGYLLVKSEEIKKNHYTELPTLLEDIKNDFVASLKRAEIDITSFSDEDLKEAYRDFDLKNFVELKI
jgi:ankyrin repeat protein